MIILKKIGLHRRELQIVFEGFYRNVTIELILYNITGINTNLSRKNYINDLTLLPFSVFYL